MTVSPFIALKRYSQILLTGTSLSLGFFLLLMVGHPANAAKKYYPPGYYPFDAPIVEPDPPKPSPAPHPARTSTPARPAKSVAPAKDTLTTMMEGKRYFDALVLVDQRLKKTPGQQQLLLTRGQILREEMRFDEADAEFKKVLAKNKSGPMRAAAYTGLGSVAYKKALVAKNLGNTADYQNAVKEAESSYRQALATSPSYPDTLIAMAQLQLLQQKKVDARSSLKKVKITSKTPSLTALLYYLTSARLALSESKYSQALNEASIANKKYPDNPDFLLIMGEASLAMARTDDAIIDFRKVLSREPDNTEALKLLSTALDKKQLGGEAETALQRAVTLNPADMDAVRALLDIYEEKNQNARGILLLRSLLGEGSTLEPSIKTSYQRELLTRLYRDNQWEEAYSVGTELMERLLADNAEKSDAIDAEVAIYSHVAYYHNKGMLDPTKLIRTQLIQNLLAYSNRRLAANPNDLEERLDLVLLDPTLQPPPPNRHVSYGVADLPIAIKLFYIQGDWEGRKGLISHLNQLSLSSSPPELDLKARVHLADELIQLGDYAGAQLVLEPLRGGATEPMDKERVDAAHKRLTSLEKEANDQWTSLKLLPKNIPASHWEQTAEAALRLGSGNWKLHAFIANFLLSQKKPLPAYFQQVQAARFAPTLSEKKVWAKKAQKTEQQFPKSANR